MMWTAFTSYNMLATFRGGRYPHVLAAFFMAWGLLRADTRRVDGSVTSDSGDREVCSTIGPSVTDSGRDGCATILGDDVTARRTCRTGTRKGHVSAVPSVAVPIRSVGCRFATGRPSAATLSHSDSSSRQANSATAVARPMT